MSWSKITNYDIPFYVPASYRSRSNKLCRLPNGLLTLIISDPSIKSAGCSLTVASGSHNDPELVPGLAHLCEHMILAAGSKTYPDPGLYHELLAQSNGSQNAFTTGEQTTFYFELPSVHVSEDVNFESILDIFSSFFRKPLFNQLLTNKEIYAIESEHENNMSSSTKILYQAERILANQLHPFSKFSTGNISSLSTTSRIKKVDLKALLFEYFESNFYAENMSLVIKGPQSLNGLTKLALSKFGDLKQNLKLKRQTPNSPKLFSSPPIISMPISPLSTSSSTFSSMSKWNPTGFSSNILDRKWRKRYENIKCFPKNPVKNALIINSKKQSTIRFIFPIDLQSTLCSKKELIVFSNIWCDLFGDESENSICKALEDLGYITECFAFTSDFASDTLGLILEFKLTNIGLKNFESIVEFIMKEAIPSLISTDNFDVAQFLSETTNIDIVKFLTKTPESSIMDECSDLSGLLQEDSDAFDFNCLFKGTSLFTDDTEYGLGSYFESPESKIWWCRKSEKFKMFLKTFMTPELLRLVLLCDFEILEKKFRVSELKIDQYYNFEYYLENLGNSTTQNLTTLKKHISFPYRNVFIPELGQGLYALQQLLNKFASESRSSTIPIQHGLNNVAATPFLMMTDDNFEVWGKDEPFVSVVGTKTILSFELLSLKIKSSPEATMNLEVLAQILYIILSSKLYPSLKLGYTYEISTSAKGDVNLEFTISGFPENLKEIVKIICFTCLKFVVDDDFPSNNLFRRARILTRTKYLNASSDNCVKLGSVGLLILLEKHMWALEERLDALDITDKNSFKTFCKKFFVSSFRTRFFLQGDLTCAEDIITCFQENLLKFSNRLDGNIVCDVSHTKIIEPGKNYYFEHNGHGDDPNNCIVYFVQTGVINDRINLTMTLLTDYLMSLSLVDNLRNSKQIGYVVLGGFRSLSDTYGLHVTVMSGNEPYDLEEKINEYFAEIEYELQNISKSEFKFKYIRPYLKMLESNEGDDIRKLGGSANLLDEIVANVQAGDSSVFESDIMKQHKKLKTSIFNGTNNFEDNLLKPDKQFIQNLDLKTFLQFFRSTISIHSSHRAKLSIFVSSPMKNQEIMNKRIFLQLETFLKMKGFTIQSEELKSIIEESNGKPGTLIKKLFRYFKKKNEAWHLFAAISNEILRLMSSSLKLPHVSLPMSSSSSSKHPLTLDVQPYQKLVQLRDASVFK